MTDFLGRTGHIHHHTWTPSVGPVAVVVFFHGLGEHLGLYDTLAAALNAAGIELWALDHAGHGRSDGERVLVTDADALLDDAAHLVRLAGAARPGLPLVVAGHSLGATVALLLTGERLGGDGPPDGLILSGIGLPGPGEGAARGLRAQLEAAGIDPLELRKDPSELSRNVAYADRLRADPLVWSGGIRPETLDALEAAGPRVIAVLHGAGLDLPVLFVHGERDDLAPAAAVLAAAEELPDARARVFAGDLHNVLNEIDRDEVHAEVVRFVLELSHPSGDPRP